MAFRAFHKETTRFLCNHRGVKTEKSLFATVAAANAAITREAKRLAIKAEDFSILRDIDFVKIEKTETVTALLSGKQVTVSVNSPWCCNPASETYYSM